MEDGGHGRWFNRHLEIVRGWVELRDRNGEVALVSSRLWCSSTRKEWTLSMLARRCYLKLLRLAAKKLFIDVRQNSSKYLAQSVLPCNTIECRSSAVLGVGEAELEHFKTMMMSICRKND